MTAKPSRTTRLTWVTATPLMISATSLIISIGGFVYTIRSYSVSHRPYLGVVETSFQFVEDPPRAMIWKLVVKNTGSQPATMRDENWATLTTSSGVEKLPSLGAIEDTVTYIMPGQTAELQGQYSEVNGPIRMQDILNGSALLDVHTRLTYTGEAAIGSNRYSYYSQTRFHTVNGGPRFAMVKAEGN